MDSFEETGLREEILKAVADLGFEKPTPIQAKAIPHLLESDRDLIALAQTGTGKTAAFGLPMIHSMDESNKATQGLVLAPTRELCLQIAKDLKSYAKHIKGFTVVAVYGGASVDTQIKALKKGAQIVVGTPGRTKDLINRRRLILGNIEQVALDEADEMLTMGFKDELDAILGATPDEKQTLLFSATMSKEVLRISKTYMNNPEQIAVAKMNLGASTVQHIFHMVPARYRYDVVRRIADMNPNIYGIVFCRTRRETIEVANKLIQDGYPADVLNGELSQGQRDEVMKKFRSKQVQMLVATDVAARGLDVNDLTHVINYNLPDDSEVYTHRSGRTGRAGKSGISIVIIHSREQNRIRGIERVSGVRFTQEPVPTGEDICKIQLGTYIDKIENVEVQQYKIEPFMDSIYEKLAGLSKEELIQHFVYNEFNRFLEYYKNAPDLNGSLRSNGRDRGERGDRGGRSSRDRDSFTRFFINVGKKDNLTPARLIGVINEGLRSANAGIGKIEILRNFSFFEVEKGLEDKLISSLTGKDFEGVDISVEISQKKKGHRGSGGGSDQRRRGGGGYSRSGGGSGSGRGGERGRSDRGRRRKGKK